MLLVKAQRRAEEDRKNMLAEEKRRRAEFRAGDVSGNNYAAWDESEMVGEPAWWKKPRDWRVNKKTFVIMMVSYLIV